MEQEVTCWQCGTLLKLPPEPPDEPAQSAPSNDGVPITFTGPTAAQLPPQKRTMVTLTGEVVELDEPAPNANGTCVAASIGGETIAAEPNPNVMVLTFCKNCGFQNEEGVKTCQRCRLPLEVVLEPLNDIAMPARAWGFDVLGVMWILLGFAAMFSKQFLLHVDPQHPNTWADYFWTGVVVCIPGFLIFMRHVFCKVLFWVMTLGSLLVWLVIGTIWILGHLYVSDNGQVGLTWLACFSALSAVSYFTVRTNDAFDFSL